MLIKTSFLKEEIIQHLKINFLGKLIELTVLEVVIKEKMKPSLISKIIGLSITEIKNLSENN